VHRFRAAAWAAALFCLGYLLWFMLGARGDSLETHLLTRICVSLASLSAALACGRAALRAEGESRRGWALFSLTGICWFVSNALNAAWEIKAHAGHEAPAQHLQPDVLSLPNVPATVGMVLSVLAVLSFLGAALSSAARMRALLDSLLIAGSLLFAAWDLVLQDLYRAGQEGTGQVLALAYPITDIVLASLVLVALMRAGPGSRLPWTLLAAALGALIVGHSNFAYLELAEAYFPGVLDFSLIVGYLLLGLAALAADEGATPISHEPRPASALQVLVPYIPVALAGAVAIWRQARGGLTAFLMANGGVIVVLLVVRQLLAQLENLELAHSLDARVRERTAELQNKERHFRSLVQNASDVLTVVDEGHVITYQSASVERVLGFRPEHLVGTSFEDLLHPEDRVEAIRRIRSAKPSSLSQLSVEARLRRWDGTWCVSETTVNNLLEDDSVQGIVLTTRDVAERKELLDELRHQALHDPLTGLANRTLLRDRLQHAVARGTRESGMLALVMVDLDNFKQVNDTLGHPAGDRVLTEVARRLSECVRGADTVARMGGDEFAILLERAVEHDVGLIAQRIKHWSQQPMEIDGQNVVVEGSVGVAWGHASGLDAEELLCNADLAMYAAKASGKGSYQVFDPKMQALMLEREKRESELREALMSRQLVLHYQPIVDVSTGRVSGLEALARWVHPERGLLPPSDFIPLAEESELVLSLGRWALAEACTQARRFRSLLPGTPLTMAVNVAATRQLTSPWLVEDVRSALRDSGLPPASLVLEITEGALIGDVSSIIPTLHALKDLGVQLAIDDFGAGWSSLSRLRSFPVDKLKIDRSFVQELGSSNDESSIVAAVVAMASSLRLSTVAEGVETREQLSCLRQHGCDEVQGYLLSQPLPASELAELLASTGGRLERATTADDELSDEEHDFMGLVAEATITAGGIEEMVRPVLRELQRVSGADCVYVTEIDWSQQIQEVRYAWNTPRLSIPEGTRWSWAHSPCSHMLTGGPRFQLDVAEQSASHELVTSFGVVSHLSVPVRAPDGRVFGTLCAADMTARPQGKGDVLLFELSARLLEQLTEHDVERVPDVSRA
jgi:diguanylate cyclase (GGDEF)-like protein/PAS domain S-box-containing protein